MVKFELLRTVQSSVNKLILKIWWKCVSKLLRIPIYLHIHKIVSWCKLVNFRALEKTMLAPLKVSRSWKRPSIYSVITPWKCPFGPMEISESWKNHAPTHLWPPENFHINFTYGLLELLRAWEKPYVYPIISPKKFVRVKQIAENWLKINQVKHSCWFSKVEGTYILTKLIPKFLKNCHKPIFHWIGPYADSVKESTCPWLCPLRWGPDPRELETSGPRVYW